MPKTNATYWSEKLERNVSRDAYNEKMLHSLGWRTFIVWECELKNNFQDLLERLTFNIKHLGGADKP